jgi:hypothetical protein
MQRRSEAFRSLTGHESAFCKACAVEIAAIMLIVLKSTFLLILVIGLCGCSKKRPASPRPSPQSGGVSVESLLSQPATSSEAASEARPPERKEEAAESTPRADGQPPSPEMVYEATRKFFEVHGRSANDLNELINKGFLPKLPPPPPGKKYLLNQRGGELQLVDK